MSRDEHDLLADPDPLFAAGDPHGTILNMILLARTVAQVVRCAALFSVADHLANGPATAEQIAEAEKLDAGATFRLMRACTAFGLMSFNRGGYFSETPLLRTLRKSDPRSLRDMAISTIGLGHWLPWGRLDAAIRTGQPQARAALGHDIWDYYASADGAEEAQAFNRALAGFNAAVAADAARLIDTSSLGSAVDVGGATGSMIRALMQRNPALRGVVLDIPRNEPDATQAIRAQGLQDRLSFLSGDFFKEVPAADLYLMKHVLHDWPDNDCVAILRTCRRAASRGARLIVVETVEDQTAPTPWGVSSDLLMLAVAGGKERTLEDFKTLFAATGFRFSSVTPTTTPFSLIAAVAD